eukprot:592533-Prymnesium_polylepis.1
MAKAKRPTQKKTLTCVRSPRVASNARDMLPVGPRSARPGAQLQTNRVTRMTCISQRMQTKVTA